MTREAYFRIRNVISDLTALSQGTDAKLTDQESCDISGAIDYLEAAAPDSTVPPIDK